jgi:hypothetical protein
MGLWDSPAIATVYLFSNEEETMKKLGLLAVLFGLSAFTIGCEPAKKPATTPPADTAPAEPATDEPAGDTKPVEEAPPTEPVK